jgi:acetyl-CoA carboxylase carboxyl transferase subunit beta
MEKTKLKDAVRTGKIKGREVVICCMDFAFIEWIAVVKKISRGSLYQNKFQ